MVGDITALMAAGSSMMAQEALSARQQTDGYRDLYEDALKKLQNPEKRDEGNPADKTEIGMEKPGEEDGKQPEAGPDGSLFSDLAAGMQWQSVLWLQQAIKTTDATAQAAAPGQGIAEAVQVQEQAGAVLFTEEAENGKAAAAEDGKPADKAAFILQEPETPLEKNGRAENPEVKGLKIPVEGKKEQPEKTAEKEKQPETAVKPETSVQPQKGNPEMYVQPEDMSVKNPGFVNTAVTAEENTAHAGQRTVEEQFGKLPEEILTRMSAGEREFSVQLEPESLGKLVIKASYMEGKATVSIICTNEKTLQLLSGHAREIGSILESNMGTPTNVVLDKTEPDYLEHNQNGQDGQQNRQEQDNRKKNAQKEDGMDFLHQLRLGLV